MNLFAVVALIDPDLKSFIERVTTLEQWVRGDERIAVVIFAILGAMGVISYQTIKRGLARSLAKSVEGKIQAKIARADAHLKENEQKFDELHEKFKNTSSAAAAALTVLQAQNLAKSRESGYVIQMGSDDVTFNDTNYLRFDVAFQRPFPVEPNVFVGEAKAGAWLIVKVDRKDSKGFTWAANNLLGASRYSTTIQWIAIAKAQV